MKGVNKQGPPFPLFYFLVASATDHRLCLHSLSYYRISSYRLCSECGHAEA
jgi:hypothetical protein